MFGSSSEYTTVVYNLMKTTFDFNFDLYQALNSIDTQKHGNKKNLFYFEKSVLTIKTEITKSSSSY